jgi:hypothetical protein
MSDKINDEVFQIAPKKPNFLLILILSGITLIVMFLAAYLLLSDEGKKLLPGLHPDPHPTSYAVPKSPLTVDA